MATALHPAVYAIGNYARNFGSCTWYAVIDFFPEISNCSSLASPVCRRVYTVAGARRLGLRSINRSAAAAASLVVSRSLSVGGDR